MRFEDHTGLIGLVIRRHKYLHACGSLTSDDLFQAGSIGLMRAIETFDETRGRFASWAIPWIRQAIAREIANRAADVRAPVNVQHRRWRKGERVREACRSLDAPFLNPDGRECNLHDLIPAPSPDPGAARDAAKLLAVLSAKERRVLQLRFFGGALLEEVAEDIGGLSRERARQIEQGALAKLRRHVGLRSSRRAGAGEAAELAC